MRNTLLIVDVQNDFLAGGSLPVPDGGQVIPVINEIMPKFSLIVATRDWHPENHVSFASNHPGKKAGDVIKVAEGRKQRLWPDHCVAGTFGAELSNQLDQSRIARVFDKGTDPAVDAYSGFFAADGTPATELAEFFRENHVSNLFIVGLALDYCVKDTAIDAASLGFYTVVLTDACRSVNPYEYEKVHRKLSRGKVTPTVSRVLELLW